MQRPKTPILLVDDNEDIREGLRTILEAEGFTIEVVRDGRDALNKLLGGLRPCMILFDLMSPTMNGVEFHQQQLEHRGQSHHIIDGDGGMWTQH